MDSAASVSSKVFLLFFAFQMRFRRSMYTPLAAASKTELLKIVIGKRNWEMGDTPEAIIGLNSVSVEKGRARAMHIKALESAPPNPPE